MPVEILIGLWYISYDIFAPATKLNHDFEEKN